MGATSQAVIREMRLALAILAKSNKILDRFDWVANERAPAASLPEGVVMTRSMDASTHFQDVMNEVFQIYQNITGKKFDLKNVRSAKDIQREAQEKDEAEEKARAEAAAAAATTE